MLQRPPSFAIVSGGARAMPVFQVRQIAQSDSGPTFQIPSRFVTLCRDGPQPALHPHNPLTRTPHVTPQEEADTTLRFAL